MFLYQVLRFFKIYSPWYYHFRSKIKCTPTGFQQKYAIVEQLRSFFITCNWWLFFVGTSYIDIPHNIGYYPDYVIVQLKLPDNYISEAQGSMTQLCSLSLPLSWFAAVIRPKYCRNGVKHYKINQSLSWFNHQILFLGTTFKKAALSSHNTVCGVIMAYDSTNIRLWPSHSGPGSGECK